ncbi:podoplanin [Salminus brasiliensis]|uniref:podoplanin n=1 Tax=Salminus brasiliensis TaxID=930266 RepID=UPI003B8371C5
MKFELLLLFALVGPFCTITHASTLVVPTKADLTAVTDAAAEPTDATVQGKLDIVTAAPENTMTEAPATPAPEFTLEVTEEPAAETQTPVLPTTAEQVEPAATVAEPEATKAPAVDEATNTSPDTDIEENLTHGTEAQSEAEQETGAEVEVEESGLSTGHVVGIVIGALVTVVIIIAVIVVVVRRMGQYSP